MFQSILTFSLLIFNFPHLLHLCPAGTTEVGTLVAHLEPADEDHLVFIWESQSCSIFDILHVCNGWHEAL